MTDDPDLPGERESFAPATSSIEITLPGGLVAMASVTPKPIAEQLVIHHNQLRYAELQKLRRGQPNLYRETRYR